MKIAVAQIRSIKGNIAANIETHIKYIHVAISYKADALFFPELSLTGYEPARAKELASDQNDERFNTFQEISNTNKITIALGMPIKTDAGIEIGLIIFQPHAARQTYSKQQLHPDEFPYFVHGQKQIMFSVKKVKVAPAICYESLQANHAEHANKLGAEIYAASAAKSQNGIDKGMKHYPVIAHTYSMPLLLANGVGYCDNFECAGQSSVWTKQGILAAQLGNTDEGMLLFDTETEEVIIY